MNLHLKQTGVLNSESVKFDFEVTNCAPTSILQSSIISTDPVIAAIHCALSGHLNDDWISTGLKNQAAELLSEFEEYYKGENEWRNDYKMCPSHWVARKSQPLRWDVMPNANIVMDLLINVG
jgi:hypothetical protein